MGTGTAFGSPERVITQMKRYMHECGATSFMHQMRFMELFAKHVMPALREEEAKMKSATAAV